MYNVLYQVIFSCLYEQDGQKQDFHRKHSIHVSYHVLHPQDKSDLQMVDWLLFYRDICVIMVVWATIKK